MQTRAHTQHTHTHTHTHTLRNSLDCFPGGHNALKHETVYSGCRARDLIIGHLQSSIY